MQGVFAFFSVQNFNSQAESGLRKIGETRTHLEKEFRDQFPLAAKMEELLDQALQLLDSHFQDADSYENPFDEIGAQGRQEVLFYERVIAGFASLKVPKFRERLGRAFRGLGTFYTSKFREALPSLPLGSGIPKQIEEDLERARFYLGKALERNDQDFAAMNMFGYIALTVQRPPDVEEARRRFSQSGQIQPDQQRAYFNLANIAYLTDHNVDVAIQLYRDALCHRRWEFKASAQHATYLKFNLACVLVQRWDKTKDGAAADEAIDLLTDTMETGRRYIETHFEKERREGDLVPLQRDSAYARRLNTIWGL